MRELPDRQPQIRVTAMPTDMNPYGGVFGGWLMNPKARATGSFDHRAIGGAQLMKAFKNLVENPMGLLV